jgi:hypothetical protein
MKPASISALLILLSVTAGYVDTAGSRHWVIMPHSLGPRPCTARSATA